MKFSLRLGILVSSFFSSILWSVNLILFLYTLLVYYLLIQLPSEHWIAGVLMISLPVAWGGNLLFMLIWLLIWPWRSVLPLLTMLIGFPFWRRTVAFNWPKDNPEKQIVFQIMSYNVLGFNRYGTVNTAHPDNANRMIEWIVNEPSEIKCFQEFYNVSNSVVFRTVKRLTEKGFSYHTFLHPPKAPNGEGFVGIAIFSRYPIIHRGEEVFGQFNGVVWADIKIRSDTIRVINTHLQSMGIRVGPMLDKQKVDHVKQTTQEILRGLRYGFTKRREQIQRIEDYCRQSPYPVIICGDFNDTPYSVAYIRLRRLLRNAFEDGGRGFGFSYNKTPAFIRIDNQFYTARFFDVLNFVTYRSIDYSDHYPIVGRYAFNPYAYGQERTPRTEVRIDF